MLPGSDAAPLYDRQLWWVATASCSAAGVWLAVFARSPILRVLGLVLLFAPHVVGTPRAPIDGANLDDLAKDFIRATYLANAALWLSLGALLGVFGKPAKSPQATSEVAPAEPTK